MTTADIPGWDDKLTPHHTNANDVTVVFIDKEDVSLVITALSNIKSIHEENGDTIVTLNDGTGHVLMEELTFMKPKWSDRDMENAFEAGEVNRFPQPIAGGRLVINAQKQTSDAWLLDYENKRETQTES